MGTTRSIERRDFLRGLTGLGAMVAMAGGIKVARAATVERKFLFLFASGGWDTTYVFEPKIGASGVDMDPEATLGQVGDLRYTAGERWAAVGRYFQRWGGVSCIVNGIDSHSVGHDSSTQFMLTGTSASSSPDWPTIIASHSAGDYPLPHIVLSGPSFPGNSGNTVVRGGGGVLFDLIDGQILGQSDEPAPLMAAPSMSMVDAFVQQRTARYAATVGSSSGKARADGLLAAVERGMELKARRYEANLTRSGGGLFDRAVVALDAMRLGLCRTAMVTVGFGWDTHSGNQIQGDNFDSVFSDLDLLMEAMATTPGHSAPWLLDEVTLVVMSEFGRTPRSNGMGKDHWPYTSVLMAGSGVAGGRSLGYTDDGLVAQPVDYDTGEYDPAKSLLASENLGAAFLGMGGVDSNDYFPGILPFNAVRRS